MDFSVIILNWNAREWLERSVGSALDQEMGSHTFEVICIDNASTDGSVELLGKRFGDRCTVIALDENLGFAGGNNVGIAAASGRIVFLLNPDTITHPGAFAAIIDFMDAHPQCGIAGPKLLNSDGSLQYSCRHFATLEAGFFRNTPLGRLFPGNRATRDYLMKDVSHDAPMQVDWVSGAAMAIRREVIDTVGVLDEGYFMYVEDVDLCYRAKAAGLQTWYAPEAVITHAIAQSSDKNPLPMIRAFHRSMFRFFRKHYLGQRYAAWLTPFVATGLAVRVVLVVALGYWKKLTGKGPR
jgi:GT2 family glycosyltransferase